MRVFRKKPVVVEAEQFEWPDGSGPPDIPGVKYGDWVVGEGKPAPVVETAYVETLEGPLHVSRGDWIIRGVRGEVCPCKDDIFRATYEEV